MKQYLCVVILIILLNSTLWSQEENSDKRTFAACYVMNPPYQFAGFSIMNLYDKKIGIYADLKAGGFVSDDELYEHISRNYAENVLHDDPIGTKRNYASFDIGITKRVFKRAYAYLSGGMTFYGLYRRYYDHFEILGTNGKYYIEDSTDDRSKPIVSAGLLVKTSNSIAFQFGLQSYPAGLNIGIGFSPH